MKVAFYTLGCKVNQNETSALQQLFLQDGYEVVSPQQTADVYVINSCTVTAGGDKRSLQWLRRTKRQNPNAVTVLTGCFPQAFPQKANEAPADIICGTVNRQDILPKINTFLQTRKPIIDITTHTKDEPFEELPIKEMQGHTRAFIKVEDGCNRQCAYCVIPRARGKVRSRQVEPILEELQSLAKAGHKEVVFTGINLPSYGKDTNTNLGMLIQQAASIQGIERLRLSSLDPDLITNEQIDIFANEKKFCPQFHLSLQSGCDETLKRMRRPYTTDMYKKVATLLRQVVPDASLTTDVIVGFPGETQQEFEQSLDFVREMQFLKVHVFPFSVREDTPAAGFENQVDETTKAERVHILQKVADQQRADWIAGQKNKIQDVLLEQQDENGCFTGYTKNYIPVYVQNSTSKKLKQNDIVTVKLGDFDGNRCQSFML